MARPPHKPDDKSRKQVETLAGLGLPQEQIGRVIGLSHVTLRKHYAEELEAGVAKANMKVVESLYTLATAGPAPQRAACSIFWTKVRLGWKETQAHEHTGKDGGAIQVESPFERITGRLARLSPEGEAGGDPEGPDGG